MEDNPQMQELYEYCSLLCETLNENGFRQNLGSKENPQLIEYKVWEDQPFLSLMSITSSLEAWEFLKSNGLIRNDICHECGKKPIDDTFRFIEPTNKINLNVCRNCHPKGNDIGIDGGGCMVTILFFISILLGFSI